MIVPAKNYENEIKTWIRNNIYDEKYIYYFSSWHSEYTIEEHDYNERSFCSIDNEGNLLGLITYSIDRPIYAVSNLSIINFTGKSNMTFSKDVLKLIDDLFVKFRFNKVNFNVKKGNKAEILYDKFIEKHGGRIVGIYKADCKLWNDDVVDKKSYEILREEYLS